jgi:hypothetical protein
MGSCCAVCNRHEFHGYSLSNEILTAIKNLISRKFKWGPSLFDTVHFDYRNEVLNKMLTSIISRYTKTNKINVFMITGFEDSYISTQMASYIIHVLIHKYVNGFVPEFNEIPIPVNEIFVDKQIGEYYNEASRVQIRQDFVVKFLKDIDGNKIENIDDSMIQDNLKIKMNALVLESLNHIIQTNSYLRYDHFMRLYKEKNEEYERKKETNLKQIMV